MFWTEEHDKLMCREILAVDPFTGTKKGTVQRGAKWKEVVDNLMAIDSPKFKVHVKAVRDRYNLISRKLREKLKAEERASGIETEMTETEQALEEITEKEDYAESEDSQNLQAKAKEKELDKAKAADMRKKAMERLGETQKRKGEEGNGKKKKKRANGNETIVFLREKNEMLQEMKREEIEMKKKEVDLQVKKHDDLMKLIVDQQQQQQNFQAMMLAMMQRVLKEN